MDLSDFLPSSDEVVVELKNPKTKEPMGMTVTLYATHTEEFKDVQYRYIDAAIARNSKARKEGKDDYTPSAKETDEGRVNQLAEITKSWDITLDGKKPKLTVEKAKEVYKKFTFIRLQLEKALEESEDFT